MMPCNPPTFPPHPTLVCPQSLVRRDFGSLGAFSHNSLHTRKGGDSRPYEPLYILPTSQNYKNNNKNILLYYIEFGNFMGCWEV